jgi:hypothetical protein
MKRDTHETRTNDWVTMPLSRLPVLLAFTGLIACSSAPTEQIDADGTISLAIDLNHEHGKFSPYLFMASMAPDDQSGTGYRLTGEGGFKAISFALMRRGGDQTQAAAMLKYGLTAVVFFNPNEFVAASDLESRLNSQLDDVEVMKANNPGLVMDTYLFGNEPEDTTFWKGTREQFYENFATFARTVKAHNPSYVVGGPGFQGSPFWGKNEYPREQDAKEWVDGFVEYMCDNAVPLDFVSFHSYSTEIQSVFVNPINYLNDRFAGCPNLSPLFGDPYVANTEWDTPVVMGGGYDTSKDTTWRAAHNILALSAMANDGLWMSMEFGGPFRNLDPASEVKCSFTWVKNDQTIKPVYYGHKAFNALADTIRIPVIGANFETFGAVAGKSADGNSVTVVLANYDEPSYLEAYPEPNAPAMGNNPPKAYQTDGLSTYTRFALKITNLPWAAGTKVEIERSLVDDEHNLEVVEKTTVKTGSTLEIERDTQLPEVQLIKITKL